MRFEIPYDLYGQLVLYAKVAGDYERCGFVLQQDGELFVCRIDNIAEDPRREFLFDPNQQIEIVQFARDKGMKIVATWHTHPSGDPTPSDTDLASAKLQGASLIHLIVGGDNILAYRLAPMGYERIELEIS